MNHSDHTFLIHDMGLFCSFAETLAKTGARTMYYGMWEDQNPHSNAGEVGIGLPGVERVMDFEDALTKCDKKNTTLIFPDIHFGGKQMMLRDMGWAVWGSAHADELENDRPFSKKHFEKVGLKVGKWQIVKGIDALISFLKVHPGWFVKISRFRGDTETKGIEDVRLARAWFDRLRYDLGPKGDTYPFIVEAPIKEACEIAYDGIVIDDQVPKHAPFGVEVKSQCYVGHFVPYDKLPKQIKETNTALAPFWKSRQCRNMAAVEMRIKKDGTAWMLDASQRFTSPCSELAQIWYKNWADIVIEGARGDCIDPIPTGEFGVQLVLHSETADKGAEVVLFPQNLREHVKLRNCARRGGVDAVLPQDRAGQAIGAVVAVGDTMEAAIKKCCEVAEQVKSESLEADVRAFDKARKAIEELKSYGITF